MCDESLTAKLLRRGDIVSLDKGRLIIKPASGKSVPKKWLEENRNQIITEIVQVKGVTAYQYLSYSTGKYGRQYFEGANLQFLDLITKECRYTIFNVNLSRSRTTKHGEKGSPLPKGQFRISQRHLFYKFWAATGLKIPKLSTFHDYMGKLKPIVFTGLESHGERLDTSSLKPIHFTALEIRKAFSDTSNPAKDQTRFEQVPAKDQTRIPDKETSETYAHKGLQENQSTGKDYYGKKVIRESGYKETITLLKPSVSTISKPPQDQSYEEWLASYSNGN